MTTETEEPVTTIVRLLSKNLRVVREDGSLANVLVTERWYDRELLKDCDGQVTVGLDRSEDQKVGFSGTARRRNVTVNVNVWTVNKPEQSVTGRKMRDKIRAEVNRVLREKRNKPNETPYDFAGGGPTAGTHKAFQAGSEAELTPDSIEWTELGAIDYEKIWYSDDDRFSKSVNVNLQRALMMFRFRIDADRKVVKTLRLSFEGYGLAPSGNGVTVKVWNCSASGWQQAQSGTGTGDEQITILLTSSVSDFVDSSGYVSLLAMTTNPSDGATAAVLNCDYVNCNLTVEGITYCDVVSYRDEDRVDVKPFVWRTEFTVKSWLFENIVTT